MAPTLNNEAAWIMAEKARPFEVGPGPKPDPADNEVVIKVAYAAVNPTDWKMQDIAYFKFEYPFILGTDVSGTVAQLGSGVTRFKIGQRVIGHCDSLISRKKTNAGYQLYTTCLEMAVSVVPDSMPLANAAVLPLSISTAASALFVVLDLPFPSLNPKPANKTVLIWGGSSSCGSSAVQLAIAAGYTVATTASSANQDYCKALGAEHVFDHSDPDVVDKISKVLRPGDAVIDCISEEKSQIPCAQLLAGIGGGTLPILLWPLESYPENVQGKFVNGMAPVFEAPHIGDAVWRKYIPEALAAGKFQAKPDPMIIKGGLEKVQEGVDILRRGVSAKKVVIEISPE